MQYYIDVCFRCGKKVIKTSRSGSSDMVETSDGFLYLCDVKKGESSRPSLQLRDYNNEYMKRTYCLDCLLAEVSEWVMKMKKRGSSNIPFNDIIIGNIVPSPCPICGKVVEKSNEK